MPDTAALRRAQSPRNAASLIAALAFALLAASCRPATPTDPATPSPQSVASPPSATSPASAPIDVNAAVEATLRRAYPEGFDPANRCWRASLAIQDDTLVYCMRAQAPQVVEENGQRVIYVLTASASDIAGNPTYVYGATDPGLMGAFAIRVSDTGTTDLVASSPTLETGSAGDCGCSRARLVKLGAARHAWHFVSGGTWQGTTVSSHALVTPVGTDMRDVSGIPHAPESDAAVTYDIAISSDDAAAAWYPIRVTKMDDKAVVDTRDVRFDPASGRYDLPRGF